MLFTKLSNSLEQRLIISNTLAQRHRQTNKKSDRRREERRWTYLAVRTLFTYACTEQHTMLLNNVSFSLFNATTLAQHTTTDGTY